MSELRMADFHGLDVLEILHSLRRPRLLIRAAKIGVEDYRRERDLRRLTPGPGLPSSVRALDLLLTEEDRLNHARREGAACYNIKRHVAVMIAILGEARLLPRPVI